MVLAFKIGCFGAASGAGLDLGVWAATQLTKCSKIQVILAVLFFVCILCRSRLPSLCMYRTIRNIGWKPASSLPRPRIPRGTRNTASNQSSHTLSVFPFLALFNPPHQTVRRCCVLRSSCPSTRGRPRPLSLRAAPWHPRKEKPPWSRRGRPVVAAAVARRQRGGVEANDRDTE